MPGSASERAGILRSGARMFAAQTQATTPKFTVVLRKAYGFGSMVMGMIPFDGQSSVFTFPGATMGAMGAAAAAALGRWLDPRRHILVHFVTRQQGLIARPHSHIRDVHDLARPGVRFIHRQNASDPGAPGQEDWSVAAAVAQGRADAGFGLRPDAVRFNLDFVPLAVERYFLACSRRAARGPALRTVLAAVRSTDFRQRVAALPGYDIAKSGTREPLDAALNWVTRTPAAARRRRSSG